jgi:hypothetical protein
VVMIISGRGQGRGHGCGKGSQLGNRRAWQSNGGKDPMPRISSVASSCRRICLVDGRVKKVGQRVRARCSQKMYIDDSSACSINTKI